MSRYTIPGPLGYDDSNPAFDDDPPYGFASLVGPIALGYCVRPGSHWTSHATGGHVENRIRPLTVREKQALDIVKDAGSLQEALAVLEDEEREFAAINKYDIAYAPTKKAKLRLTTLVKYLDCRTACFGTRQSYRAFAAAADAELSAEICNLLPPPDRSGKQDPADAQTVLYRWIRLAYKRKRGADFDLPAHITEIKKNWEELQRLLKTVSAAYGKAFGRSTAVVLRPVKEDVGGTVSYLLGTYSEHGEGNAVDVEAGANPTLNLTIWKYIHDFTGRSNLIDRTPLRWQSNPAGLWTDIKKLSDDFAQAVAREVKRWKEVVKWAFVIRIELSVRERQQQQAGLTGCRADNPPPDFLVKRLPPLPANGSYLTAPGSPPRVMPPNNDPAWAAWEQLPTLQKRYPNGIPADISDADARQPCARIA